MAMRAAVEEAISIRYMLRCLGIPVTKPTNLYGDNFSVIQNAAEPHSDIKKKHVAISYHFVREAIANKIDNSLISFILRFVAQLTLIILQNHGDRLQSFLNNSQLERMEFFISLLSYDILVPLFKRTKQNITFLI